LDDRDGDSRISSKRSDMFFTPSGFGVVWTGLIFCGLSAGASWILVFAPKSGVVSTRTHVVADRKN
jgi:hypothetical protein